MPRRSVGGPENSNIGTQDNRVKVFYGSSSPERYRLSFKYFRPGTNTCSRTNEMGPGEWECTGAW